MDNNAKELIKRGDQLFSKRSTLVSLWQSVADNFYVERADFTVNRTLGDTFADHLYGSAPLIARRDLGNLFSTMLRPTETPWFSVVAGDEDEMDQPARAWLERAALRMRRAMYDRKSGFTRATKEGDHDFAAFGNAVLSVEMNRNRDALLYRSWHLRDVVWSEDDDGMICTVHRKWKMPACNAVALFGDRLNSKIRELAEKTPYAEVCFRHIVMDAAEYDWKVKPKSNRIRSASITIDDENGEIVEESGIAHQHYIIPRWQTVSGSQYAYSPATVAALPDARLFQDMTRVLLEAGEKSTNPPMVAVQEAIRSDISIFAGGVTWVDSEYDERLGEVLRPLTQDRGGLTFGAEMRRELMAMISEAFFLNKLTMPQNGPEMTAYEVGQRVQEFIRNALPIFEPVEQDYNAPLCDSTFTLLMNAGALGGPDDVPDSIKGQETQYRFKSPIHDAMERMKGQTFQEMKGILAETLAVDPTVLADIDVHEAFRDTLTAIGVPAKWMRSEQDAAQMVAQQKQDQQDQELLAQMGQGADVANKLGQAGQALGLGA